MVSVLMGGPTGLSSDPQPYVPITYPLDVPSVAGVRNILWSREAARGISESPFTYHRKIFKHSGERLRATIILPRMRREHAAYWISLIHKLDSGAGTFLFGDLFHPNPRGHWTGSPVVNGALQTGRVLNIRGCEANVVELAKAEDTIQIGNRLYLIVADASSNADGEATLDIFPRLRESPGDGTLIRTNNTRGLFRLDKPNGAVCSVDITGTYELPMLEVVEAI